MNWKKFIRWMLGITAVLTVITFSLIGPIDRSPLAEQDFYHQTIQHLDSFQTQPHRALTQLKAGWAKVNITPAVPMPMAGYAPRNHFDAVHDSVFVRILAIDNGSVPCFIISADLLLFPPLLKNKLERLNVNGFLYFTATHAHSSLGSWDNSVLGNAILGKYDEAWLDQVANKIVAAMDFAYAHLQPSSFQYFEVDASEYVENRIDSQHGKVDGLLRGFKIIREDGSKGLFVAYSAHPTNISHLSLTLSGDYPSALVNTAERNEYTFALFGAGAVGSHRVKGITEQQFALCDTLGAKLFRKIKSSENIDLSDSSISTGTVPIHFGPSQLHVLQNFKVRDWVFNSLFRKLRGDIRYLKIGNVLLLGTPCDFSGEISVRDGLNKLAEAKGEHLIITSFDGEYVGYITYDDHYGHSEQEEIMAMNWVGPHYGAYFSQLVKKIIEKGN